MKQTKRLILASLFAAMTCVATMVIKIPSPMQGYVNLGDCVVLCCGWLLGPLYGAMAAGIGSGMADIFGGYTLYAPATMVIKGLMAATAWALDRAMASRRESRLVSGFAAECVMVSGYLAFESVLYGLGPSLLNVAPNAVQGAAGLILGAVLVNVLEKNRIIE